MRCNIVIDNLFDLPFHFFLKTFHPLKTLASSLIHQFDQAIHAVKEIDIPALVQIGGLHDPGVGERGMVFDVVEEIYELLDV
jgi:hypothetical protein